MFALDVPMTKTPKEVLVQIFAHVEDYDHADWQFLADVALECIEGDGFVLVPKAEFDGVYHINSYGEGARAQKASDQEEIDRWRENAIEQDVRISNLELALGEIEEKARAMLEAASKTK